MENNGYTHGDLCRIAVRWLTRSCKERCPVVISELRTVCNESPDVIGFNHMHSVMIEVKTSRKDFHADKKKFFRAMPELGIGDFRLYLCPEGVIKPSDLPEKWGLIYVDRNGKCYTAKEIFWGYNGDNANRFVEKNRAGERQIMYSALRRAAHKAAKGEK